MINSRQPRLIINVLCLDKLTANWAFLSRPILYYNIEELNFIPMQIFSGIRVNVNPLDNSILLRKSGWSFCFFVFFVESRLWERLSYISEVFGNSDAM